MKHNITKDLSFVEMLDGFIKYLEDMSYAESTLLNYQRTLRKIESYMQAMNIHFYSVGVGEQYCQDYIRKHQIAISRQKAIFTMIRRLNDYFLDVDYTLQQKLKIDLLPDSFETILSKYSETCYEKGNKEITIKSKLYFIRVFLNDCILQGVTDIEMLKATHVEIACIHMRNKDSWASIGEFLKFICVHEYSQYDFSTLVPKYRRPILLPVTYRQEEINKLESIIDRTTNIGKRDYLFVLLATRLGMRSGDIVNLKCMNLCLENCTITFNQEKGGQLQVLPMIPIIKNAFKDYISNSRPKTDSDYVFIRCKAPFKRITTSVLRDRITTYFLKADIDIRNKNHGPHTLRASLSTSMVNDNIPYEVVQKILGHSDSASIKRYAKLDVERLRVCAIEVPPPSSCFNDFLEGRLTI